MKSIKADRHQQTLTLVIPGDLTSVSIQALQPEIEAAMVVATGAEPWQILALDLSAAKLVDSKGLNLIVKILQQVKAVGAKMQVIYRDPNIHRVMLFTRLHNHAELIQSGPA